MTAIRVVSLDVGWTLVYPRASLWETAAALCTEAGAPTPPKACEDLVRALSAHGQQQAEQLLHDGATYSDSDAQFAAMFEQMARLMFTQFGVADGHGELVQRFVARFWNERNWALFPDTIDVLTTLRDGGFIVGVLSNAPTSMRGFLERFGIAPYLDFTVISAIEGIKKPDRRIFESALQRAGVAPHEALHVGDMYLEDVIGGRAAGLHTLLIERGERALFPNHRESHGRDMDPRSVVSDLTQVLERLHLRGAG